MSRSNHTSNRRAICLAAASAIAALFIAHPAAGVTWINPNSGNWSSGANWVGGIAPTPFNTTQLTFNATGAQTYSANNNVASPFLLNTLTLNNTGTGQINLTGSQLSFGGVTPAINVPGTGALSLTNPIQIQGAVDQIALLIAGAGSSVLNVSGPLSTSPAPTGTGGGFINQTATCTTNLSGGGNIYGIGSSNGLINLTAGAFTFSSTERGSDAVGAVSDGGQWGVSIGRTVGQTARLNIAAGVTVNANGFMVGDGGNGIGTINGGTVTMPTVGSVFFGINSGNGSIAVINGGRVTTNAIELGRQAGANATLLLDGPTSRIDGMQLVARNGISNNTISNNAALNIGTGAGIGQAFFASGTNAVATLNINSGGQFTQGSNHVVSGGQNSSATINVNTGGDLIDNAGNIFFASSAVTGAKTLINVSGAGSSLQALRPAAAGGIVSVGNTGEATLNVQNGGNTQSFQIFTASSTTGRATINVSGANSTINNSDVIVFSGGGTNAGQTTVNVSSGGAIRSQSFTFGQNAQGITNAVATGAATITTQGVGTGTGNWATASGPDSVATIDLQNGAFGGAGGAIFLAGGVGATPGGDATINVNDATLVANFLQIGQNADGNGTVNVTNGGVATINTSTIVGRHETGSGNLNISGAGSVFTTPSIVAGFANVNQGGSGRIEVSDGARLEVTGSGILLGANEDSGCLYYQSGPTTIAQGQVLAQLIAADLGNATLDLSDGAVMNMGNTFVAAGTNSTAHVLVSGGELNIDGDLQIGGSGGINGGVADVTVEFNGVVTSNLDVGVYDQGTFKIGTGTSPGRFSGGSDMVVNGTVLFNAGQFEVEDTFLVAGHCLLSDAGRNAAGVPSNKKVLKVGALQMTTSGVIDLNDNDMHIETGSLPAVRAFLITGYNNGAWNGNGIVSTAAKNSTPLQNKNLGILSGAEFLSTGATTFNGIAVDPDDVLIKYTWNGDANLSGDVNFDDYAFIDGGFNNGLTGWLNGDFNHSGSVNFDDYVLIDVAFNSQTGPLRPGIGEPAGPGFDRVIVPASMEGFPSVIRQAGNVLENDSARFAPSVSDENWLQSTPEPAAVTLVSLAMIGCLFRVRHRRKIDIDRSVERC